MDVDNASLDAHPNPFRSPALMIAPLNTTVHLRKLHGLDQDGPDWTLDTSVDEQCHTHHTEPNTSSADTLPLPDGTQNQQQDSGAPDSMKADSGSLSRSGGAQSACASALWASCLQLRGVCRGVVAYGHDGISQHLDAAAMLI